MSTNALNIRDAVFQRVAAVKPAGADAWASAKKVTIPSLNASLFPAVQVSLGSEVEQPDGDENVGGMRYVTEVEVMVVVERAFDDPEALVGQADLDADAIKDALFQDNTFTNRIISNDPNLTPKPFDFEGVTRIVTTRSPVQGDAETYIIQLVVRMTFRFRNSYEPAAPNFFEEMDVTLTGPHGTAAAFGSSVPEAAIQVGTIGFGVTGPSGGAHGTPSGYFLVTLEPGASFTGNQTITLSDGGAGGVFVPQYGSSGIGSVVVKPPNLQTYFSFQYSAPSAGNFLLSLTDAQNWDDPEPLTFIAT